MVGDLIVNEGASLDLRNGTNNVAVNGSVALHGHVELAAITFVGNDVTLDTDMSVSTAPSITAVHGDLTFSQSGTAAVAMPFVSVHGDLVVDTADFNYLFSSLTSVNGDAALHATGSVGAVFGSILTFNSLTIDAPVFELHGVFPGALGSPSARRNTSGPASSRGRRARSPGGHAGSRAQNSRPSPAP